MHFRSIIGSLFIAALHSAATAQEVELIEFGGAPPLGFVIHVGPERNPVDQMIIREEPDLTTTLAADFTGILAGHRSDTAPPATAIAVPGWMQGGRAPSNVLPALFLSPMSMGGCGDAQYRPRNDLPAATERRRLQHFPLIAAIACQEKIPVALFDALIWQESRYQVLARSPKGAIGLAQLMPGTARELGVADPWDVVQNLRGGARYLRMQIEEFGRYDLALAAYNAGPGRVRATRSIPRIRETIDYVRTITAAWANAEQRGPARFAGPSTFPTLGRPQRASVADYTSMSVANPR